jgi:acyl carrier protein
VPDTDPMVEVVRWIKAKAQIVDDPAPDADLIDSRLIDSLTFVEFLFLVEQLSGRPVLSQQIQLEHFRTLRDIEENFFATQPRG